MDTITNDDLSKELYKTLGRIKEKYYQIENISGNVNAATLRWRVGAIIEGRRYLWDYAPNVPFERVEKEIGKLITEMYGNKSHMTIKDITDGEDDMKKPFL